MKIYILLFLLFSYGIYRLIEAPSSIDDTNLISGTPSAYYLDIGMK